MPVAFDLDLKVRDLAGARGRFSPLMDSEVTLDMTCEQPCNSVEGSCDTGSDCQATCTNEPTSRTVCAC